MTVSCHMCSSDSATSGNTRDTGTGSGSPSRRATCVATASRSDESRPPEKATPQGARRTESSTTRSSARRAVSVGSVAGGNVPRCPKIVPHATSTGLIRYSGSLTTVGSLRPRRAAGRTRAPERSTWMVMMQLRQGDLTWQIAGDDVVVLDLAGSVYLKLNGTGRVLWEHLAGPTT